MLDGEHEYSLTIHRTLKTAPFGRAGLAGRRTSRLCTDREGGQMLGSEPPPGRRHTRARARQGVFALATPALRSL